MSSNCTVNSNHLWLNWTSDCAKVTKGNRTPERREPLPPVQVGRAKYWSRSISKFRHCKHPTIISHKKGPAFKSEAQVEGEDTVRVEGNGKILFDRIKQRSGKRAIRIKCVRKLPGHILLLKYHIYLLKRNVPPKNQIDVLWCRNEYYYCYAVPTRTK